MLWLKGCCNLQSALGCLSLFGTSQHMSQLKTRTVVYGTQQVPDSILVGCSKISGLAILLGTGSTNILGCFCAAMFCCAAPPTNCSAVPTASLVNGSWPANCAGKLIGETCTATCDFGGSANVTCLVSGAWESTTTGSCTGGE